MFKTSLLCAHLLLDLIAAQTEIRLIPTKKVLYASLGSNVTLMCIATALDGKPVRWDHGERQIASVAPATVVFSNPADQDKYLIQKADGGNFNFTLLNYTRNDGGDISCDVDGVTPVTIKIETLVVPDDVFMLVTSPHRVKSWNGSQSAIVFDLSVLPSVSCVVRNGLPEASITWAWNGNETVAGALNITTKKQLMDGVYNVTSTIVLPHHFVQPAVVQTATIPPEKIENITVLGLEGLEENFVEYGEAAVEKLEKTKTDTQTFGILSCEATVGDLVYKKSRIVDFSKYKNSGSGTSSPFWISVIRTILATKVILALWF